MPKGVYEHNRGAKKYEGKHYFTKYGTEFEIIEFFDYNHVTIRFVGSGIIRKTNMDRINSKTVGDPFYDHYRKRKSVIAFDTYEQKYIGTIHETNMGDKYQIIDCKGPTDFTIKFLDYPEDDILYNVSISSIHKGMIKNPYRPNQSGGYLGIGPYNTNSIPFESWRGVVERGNNHELHNYRLALCNKPTGTYDNSIIAPEWLNFQNYANDYMNMYNSLNHEYKYQIDKDLLYPYYKNSTNGMKLYSKNTCVLLPEEINKAIVIPWLYKKNCNNKEKHIQYKLEKELHIKELAEKYHNIGCLSEIAYNALINFDVDLYM